MKTRYIFVTGGVLSALGKGLAASSLGALLKARGLSVTIQKLDPYINVDPGTMNPLEHGEVFVTDDGAETDLDLGHYERYLGVPMSRKNTATAGAIYYEVIRKERCGEYQGGTVQVIPHITDEIKRRVLSLADEPEPPDTAIIEIGGTVGDIESLPFLEAIRQLRSDIGRSKCLNVHLTLVPYLRVSGELKTKPTQHSVKELLSIGIQPDIILCRCERPIPQEVKRKIALFCNVDKDAVFSAIDVQNIYQVPLTFYDEGFDQKVAILLQLPARNPQLEPWRELVHGCAHSESRVNIAVVGQHVDLREAYKSLYEALVHGGFGNRTAVDLRYVNSGEITADNAADMLHGVDGILVPGGFGSRGVDGMMQAVRYAREHKVPFFGIGLGMQCAVIEFARNTAGLPRANSEEFDGAAEDKVIHSMPEYCDARVQAFQRRDAAGNNGGAMRLGAYACKLQTGSRAYEAYGRAEVQERHRHRYEFNNQYLELFREKGMVFSGLSPDGSLVEIVELADHPWFLGCLFHPEFKSNPMNPHPLFRDFIRAAKEKKAREAG